MKFQIDDVEQELESTYRALLKYGSHTEHCHIADSSCSCGFNDLVVSTIAKLVKPA